MEPRVELENKAREMAAKAKHLVKNLSPEDAAFLQEIVSYTRKLRDLVQWLAKAYGDNDPIFMFNNSITHEVLPQNQELYETWLEVVRNKSVGEVPQAETPGADTPDVL